MSKSYVLLLVGILFWTSNLPAAAEQKARGNVTSFSGVPGDLIVSRDGVVYWLSLGDDLFENDTVRSRTDDPASIIYDGCEFTLPDGVDVLLDNEICVLATGQESSMAAISSQNESVAVGSALMPRSNAPLMVGGVLLSAGGLAAATGGDNGGTGSTASSQAGAAQSTSSSPSS